MTEASKREVVLAILSWPKTHMQSRFAGITLPTALNVMIVTKGPLDSLTPTALLAPVYGAGP